MPRYLAVAALVVSVAHGAPGLKGPEPTWFPTKEGATRVYEIRDGDRVLGSYTDVVTKVETKDGDLHVTIRRETEGNEPYGTTIAVTSQGLLRVAVNGKPRETPTLLLKTPPKVGTKWHVGKAQYEVMKEEEVEVPAGKFKAVRVELRDGEVSTIWFAPNVGVVKMASTQGPAVQVLKEFKQGK
jgi:hypothetical protein